MYNQDIVIQNGDDLGLAVVEWIETVLEIKHNSFLGVFKHRTIREKVYEEEKGYSFYGSESQILKTHLELYRMLDKGFICDIYSDPKVSYVYFNFYIPTKSLAFYIRDTQDLLLSICLRLTSQYSNYKSKGAYCYTLSPKYKDITKNGTLKPSKKALKDDLENIINNDLFKTIQTLPPDIKDKGSLMAEVYLYLYCIENTIRLFIEKVCTEVYGSAYFSKISVSPKIATEIHNRKLNAEKNKWLSVRGDSDLYYIDFKDLGELIANNWNIFERYFPGQNWIKQKVDELGNIRNIVAHNSFIGEHEKEMLRINFHTILKQING